jgi:two-component system, LuxR family, response regulator FixJ
MPSASIRGAPMESVHLFSENRAAISTITRLLRGLGLRVHPHAARLPPETPRARSCMLVDMDEPTGWWRAALAEAIAKPQLPIVLVTSRPVARDVVLAVRLGAKDVVDWKEDGEGLTAAVREIVQRGTAAAAAAAGSSRLDLLTARQRQILALASTGMASKEIARALSLSTRTVEAHRVRMVKRLMARSFLELVRQQIRQEG